MNSKLITSVLLISQIAFATGAFAQSGDITDKSAANKDIQILEQEADYYKAQGAKVAGGGAFIAFLNMAMKHDFEGERSAVSPELHKFLYVVAAGLAGYGLYDLHKGNQYQERAVNLSLSKSLPADPVNGNTPAPQGGAVVTGAK